MIFIVVFAITVFTALTHLARIPASERRAARVVEIVLLHLLCVQWGFGGALLGLPHILTPDIVANYVGWDAGSPFQIEVGFANVSSGIVGILCIWFRGWFWLAHIVQMSIFLLGAAWLHVEDILARGNLSPGNAGPVLFFDIAIPILAVSLFVAYVRTGATSEGSA